MGPDVFAYLIIGLFVTVLSVLTLREDLLRKAGK